MTDPIKNYGNNKEFYELLRSVNPHLPVPEVVAPQDLLVLFGENVIARLRIEVYITLPDLDKISDLHTPEDDAVVHEYLEHINDHRFTWACGCITITPPDGSGPSESHPKEHICSYHLMRTP